MRPFSPRILFALDFEFSRRGREGKGREDSKGGCDRDSQPGLPFFPTIALRAVPVNFRPVLARCDCRSGAHFVQRRTFNDRLIAQTLWRLADPAAADQAAAVLTRVCSKGLVARRGSVSY